MRSLRLERHDMMRRIHDDITGSILEGDIIHIQYPVNVISNLGCSCQSVRSSISAQHQCTTALQNPEPKDTREKPQKKTAMIDNNTYNWSGHSQFSIKRGYNCC